MVHLSEDGALAKTAACPHCGRRREGESCPACGLVFSKWRAYRVLRLEEFLASRLPADKAEAGWLRLYSPVFALATLLGLMVALLSNLAI